MKNKEIIYREIFEAYLNGNIKFTQLALSKKFNFSLSTVNNAVKPLEELGIITKKKMGFELLDAKKLLTYMATVRRISKDVVYSTTVSLPVLKIEASLPKNCTLTAFSAYRILFGDTPADYSEVYAYSDENTLDEIKKRFLKKDGIANLIILKADKFLNGSIAPKSQIYIDLWNIKEWYAKDFLDAFEKRIRLW